jgi:hypothetical protein
VEIPGFPGSCTSNAVREEAQMTFDDIVQALLATSSAHTLCEGVSEDELVKCEADIGLEIPLEYKRFLRFSNGADLYETEELLGTHRFWEFAITISEAVNRLRSSSDTPMPATLVPFYAGGGGQFFCFESDGKGSTGRARVVNWIQDQGFGTKTFASFEEWFEITLFNEFQSRYMP